MNPKVEVERPSYTYPLLFFGILSFSVSAILVRYAGSAPGLAVAALRTSFAVIILAPFAFPRIKKEVRNFGGKDWLLVISGGVLLGLHFVTWIESLYHTTVAGASVILAIAPILVALLSHWLLKERLEWSLILSILVAVTGSVLLVWGDLIRVDDVKESLLGNGLAISAAFLQAFYMIIGRVVRRSASWLAYVFPLYTVAALTTIVAALIDGTTLIGYDPSVYVLCALMALFPQIAGHGSFNFALKYLSAAFLSLLSLLEPVIASVLAFLLFEEMPTGIALTGMAMVLLSVGLSIRPHLVSNQ